MNTLVEQQPLVGDADDDDPAVIETNGRTIRPILSLASAVADEVRLHIHPTELTTHHIDPANVGMCNLNVYPAAFESYEAPEKRTVGVNFDALAGDLRWARMGTRTNDDVGLSITHDRTLATVEREYEDTTLTQTDEIQNIDPASIRDEPDTPNLSLPWKASVDVRALYDAIDHMSGYNHVAVKERDGHLLVSSGSGTDDEERLGQSVADFGEIAKATTSPVEGAKSLLSLDYLKDIVEGLKGGKVDDVAVYWGEEFPVRFEFARYTDDEQSIAYDGHFMLAPRIQGDD